MIQVKGHCVRGCSRGFLPCFIAVDSVLSSSRTRQKRKSCFLPFFPPFPPAYLKSLLGYNHMIIGVSNVVDTIPGDASNSEKGCHTKGTIDLYISHTVHHDSDVTKLHESTFPWLPALLYCGRFGAVQLANEAKKQIPFPPLSSPFPPLLFSPFPRLIKSENLCPIIPNICPPAAKTDCSVEGSRK